MSGLDNSAKTHYQPIFRHCLGAVLQYLVILVLNPEIWAENRENTISRYSKYSRESINLFEIEVFFFFGNVQQFISNSNSSNTKYFYDWPISNSSNTPISNYFLTVRTKEEFTVLEGSQTELPYSRTGHTSPLYADSLTSCGHADNYV